MFVTDPFVIKVVLSLVVGSVWVIGSTYVAERIGGALGGLIAGLPSTAVISLLFVGLTQGISAAVTASAIVPLSSGLYCFYFITYLISSRRGFVLGFIGALVVWFLGAMLAAQFAAVSVGVSVAAWLILVTASIAWVVAYVPINHEQIPKEIDGSPIWLKSIITGGIVGCIVVISKVAGPAWGGIFATFPALTVSTLLITRASGGIEFTRLIVKNILISTTTTIGLFAILFYLFCPIMGVVLGSILAYVVLLGISIPLYYLLFNKLKG